jgi:hypothetical protein
LIYGGAVCYSCPPGKFARLNEIAVVWEGEVDKKVTTTTRLGMEIGRRLASGLF